MTNSRSLFRPLYAHFAMIYLDHDGKLKVDESSSIQEQNSTVFTAEVCQNFLEVLDERIGYHAPVHSSFDTQRCPDPVLHALKRAQMCTCEYYCRHACYYQEGGYHPHYPVESAPLADEILVMLPSLVVYQQYAHKVAANLDAEILYLGYHLLRH